MTQLLLPEIITHTCCIHDRRRCPRNVSFNQTLTRLITRDNFNVRIFPKSFKSYMDLSV